MNCFNRQTSTYYEEIGILPSTAQANNCMCFLKCLIQSHEISTRKKLFEVFNLQKFLKAVVCLKRDANPARDGSRDPQRILWPRA